MKVYHGTTLAAWERIKTEGLKAGSFASDPAFALYRKGLDSVVIEVEKSAKMVSLGTRKEPGIECSAYELMIGEVISPNELHRVSDEELEAHRQYLQSLRACEQDD